MFWYVVSMSHVSEIWVCGDNPWQLGECEDEGVAAGC